MCGIVGILGREPVAAHLVDALKRLEYRGYDSAGGATHGKPSESNAHPHATEKVAVVHNGIIENFRELRDRLGKNGHKFGSETDTEVVAHLVTEEMAKGKTPAEAVA